MTHIYDFDIVEIVLYATDEESKAFFSVTSNERSCMDTDLPEPLAAKLASTREPVLDEESGPTLRATGDDDVNGLTTYTDD